MSLDRTLRLGSGLTRKRSVLTRAERIARLAEEEKFDREKDSPFGLPKVRVHHSKAGHKKKEVKAAEGAEGAAAAPGAAAAAPAAGAKAPAAAAAKAPAAGAKAPAAKAPAKK